MLFYIIFLMSYFYIIIFDIILLCYIFDIIPFPYVFWHHTLTLYLWYTFILLYLWCHTFTLCSWHHTFTLYLSALLPFYLSTLMIEQHHWLCSPNCSWKSISNVIFKDLTMSSGKVVLFWFTGMFISADHVAFTSLIFMSSSFLGLMRQTPALSNVALF